MARNMSAIDQDTIAIFTDKGIKVVWGPQYWRSYIIAINKVRFVISIKVYKLTV